MASIHAKETHTITSGSRMPLGSRTTLDVARQEIWTGELLGLSGIATLVWVTLLVLTAPGSYDYALSPLQRLAFFGGMGAVCWPLGHALAGSLLQCGRLRSPAALGLTAIVAGSFLAANLCAVALALEEMFFARAPDELTTGAIYLLCAVIAIPHFGLLYFMAWQRAKLKLLRHRAPVTVVPDSDSDSDARATRRAALSPAAPESLPLARFLDRMPPELGHDLVHIKGMGHYLKVVTTKGSGMVLMRFADAILELGDIGLRVHRSYWVAHRHILRLERRNGHTMIRLSSGDELPVSRTYQIAARAAVASRSAANGGAGSRQ